MPREANVRGRTLLGRRDSTLRGGRRLFCMQPNDAASCHALAPGIVWSGRRHFGGGIHAQSSCEGSSGVGVAGQHRWVGMVCLVRACAVLGMGLGNSTCVSSRCEMVCVAAWCAWLHRHGHGYTVTTCGREWSHGEACGVAAVEVRAHMDMDYGSFLVGGGAEGQQGKGESESLGARCTSRADSVRSSPAWAST